VATQSAAVGHVTPVKVLPPRSRVVDAPQLNGGVTGVAGIVVVVAGDSGRVAGVALAGASALARPGDIGDRAGVGAAVVGVGGRVVDGPAVDDVGEVGSVTGGTTLAR